MGGFKTLNFQFLGEWLLLSMLVVLPWSSHLQELGSLDSAQGEGLGSNAFRRGIFWIIVLKILGSAKFLSSWFLTLLVFAFQKRKWGLHFPARQNLGS